MASELQLSAKAVASLLARIFPSIYDAPPLGGWELGRRRLFDMVSGPRPEPWSAVMLNPQPLPPREIYALTLADAHILELFDLDRMGTLFGGEVAERALDRSLRFVAEIEERCPPLWPRWPKRVPPPPPPPWWGEEMTVTELFVFGARVLAASELVEQGQLQGALIGLGEKALDRSIQS
jgi:hypothetical protein